jgi:uncharacterized membrane protein
MMLESLGGLPTHPLVVHLPVVLVPLALIGVLVMVVFPSWQQRIGVPVAVVSGLGFLGALLAVGSGEELQDNLRRTGQTISGTLEDHAEMGESVQFFAGLFFVLVLVWVVFAWWRRRTGEEQAVKVLRKPKVINIVLAILVVGSGITATWSVYATGHSGAKSVWEKTAP